MAPRHIKMVGTLLNPPIYDKISISWESFVTGDKFSLQTGFRDSEQGELFKHGEVLLVSLHPAITDMYRNMKNNCNYECEYWVYLGPDNSSYTTRAELQLVTPQEFELIKEAVEAYNEFHKDKE